MRHPIPEESPAIGFRVNLILAEMGDIAAMAMSVSPFTLKEHIVLTAALVWASFISDYIRQTVWKMNAPGDGEALIGFGLWCLALWWVSKRQADGWSIYWFAFAVASYAFVADMVDAQFGGVLGLRTR